MRTVIEPALFVRPTPNDIYLDSVRHSSSLAEVHSVDTYFASVADMPLVGCQVVGSLADALKPAAFRDDRLEAQHSVRSLAGHMVA